MSKLTNDLRLQRTLPPDEYMPMVCGHGASAPRFCNQCRYEAWIAKQDFEARQAESARTEKAERAASAARAEEEQARRWVEYMRATYPGATRAQWARIVRDGTDAKARELANV